MKNKFNYLFKALFIFISLLFLGCETQEEVIKINNESKYKIKEYTFKEANKIAKFSKVSSRMGKNFSKINSLRSTNAREGDTDFVIDESIVKEVSVDDYTSYTMKIVREEQSTEYFENLVIEIKDDSTFAYIIKYTPTDGMESLDEHLHEFEGTIEASKYGITSITGNGGSNNLGAGDGSNATSNNTESFNEDGNGGPVVVTCITVMLCNYVPIGSPLSNPHVAYGGDCHPYPVTSCSNTGWGTTTLGTNPTGNGPSGGQMGSGTNTSPISTTSPITIPIAPILKTQEQIYTEFTATLSTEQLLWFTNTNNLETKNSIINYLTKNQTHNIVEETNPNYVFAKELIDVIKNDTNVDSNALSFVLDAKEQDKINNDLDDAFLLAIDDKLDIDVASYMLANPTDPLWIHFTIQCAVLRANHPDWSSLKIYWEASKEFVHISLDALGLVPAFGEVADLTNGVLYTIEGDGVNASLSYASAVPLAGWATISTKYAIKINEVATIGTKIKLVWKVTGDVISFGSRNQLRKVLGLLPGNPLQAHHLIPWSSQTKMVVQKAAKSGNAFHLNEALNGIAVAAWRNQPNHNIYNNVINSKLDEFRNLHPNATPDECYEFLTDLVNDIRTWVINNPSSHLNNIVLP